MPRSFIIALGVAGLLTGCAPAPGDVTEIVTEIGIVQPEAEDQGKGPSLAEVEFCDAEDYRSLAGSQIAAVTLPAGPMLRVFGVNDIVAQDYRPERTNVLFDEAGKIIRIYCG